MKIYENIPLTEECREESWYHWPQSFTVPKGWKYMTDMDRDYLLAVCDMEITLSCQGDWLEMVNEEENQRIRYSIV